jgi:hypothetical protein
VHLEPALSAADRGRLPDLVMCYARRQSSKAAGASEPNFSVGDLPAEDEYSAPVENVTL